MDEAAEPAPTCAECGSQAESEVLPLTWCTGREGSRVVVHCERCAREHLRAIEAKLDSQWW